MKLLFVVLSGVKFDVTTPEHEPLGGTESCVAYLSAQLAQTHDVTLLANTRARRLRSVQHVDLSEGEGPGAAYFEREQFDVIIVLNAPAAAPPLRGLSPHSRIVLWNHEAPDQDSVQPLAQPEVARALDAVVYVSDWQRSETQACFRFAPPACVIGNGLTPAFEGLFANPRELLADKQLRGAYTSTPHRGLTVLLQVLPRLTQPLELDIFSSMQVYQQDDQPFEPLYRLARETARSHYHGSVSQAELARQLRRVSFLAYPCIYPETFCIAALEAMAAGATVVSTELGALKSTTMGFGALLPPAAPPALVDPYARFLDAQIAAAVHRREQWAERMFAQVVQVNRECTWRRRAGDWQAFLQQLCSG